MVTQITRGCGVKVGFLDGIVKCKIRNNAVVVCTLTERARKYCSILHQTSSESKVSKQHEYNISILQDQRLKDKIQKKENSLRRKIEKKLQCVAEKEVELSNEFPDISECKKNVILSVLSNVSVINGLHFEQLWYVDHHNVLYNGDIICVKQSKKSQVPKNDE